ncbi:helix-turn-helix transcriptional regulator [Janthinobacterium sp. FT14W]|uniref:helix-turn-helix transcriptional regulator n=1 Tax=Janthinobacterium sp. FT14W TaxID=2654253 RepID=UPI00186B1918|nr:AlpA family phage regulatory protein [Janthinobacterium sp. FT14W]
MFKQKRHISTQTDYQSDELIFPQNETKKTTMPKHFQELIDAARENPNRGVLRAHPAAKKAGYAISTLWRDVKAGVFVKPIQISVRSVAWIEIEIDAILAAKTLMSRTNQKIDMKQFVELLSAPITHSDID